MTDFGGSTTPQSDKDCWQTPLWLFDALDIEFGFWLDAAASRDNTLCAHYLSEADDALTRNWSSYGAIWCNPPYSNIRPWVDKAAEQCRAQRQTVVMLLPADISTAWFSAARNTADELRLILDGRVKFIPASASDRRNSNTKGSVLFIWRPFIEPRHITTTVSLAELKRIGSREVA
ncbi:phage N-6-adenine-methyltransferase [Pluralibacter gergoviae]|uniref:phage N-6-adenine-methyltransferase n=1 Tax=Pluralibacter gergoviae TaxID=61647 RepID=UPI00190CA286|nr:phage N-6-adenine-methyltransferase [Pluralibacter gergoviae]MBK4119373.1 phage N-6-adenine-methyltransferase [Pluralibacter gergoviae]